MPEIIDCDYPMNAKVTMIAACSWMKPGNPRKAVTQKP
jgi:hypothetical protein